MVASESKVLAIFHGDETFPVGWEEGERELFWVLDDLHCPNPLSPLFFDLGSWWLTCDHMFRRFGTPFACDWIAKVVNGYVYTAAIPCEPELHAEATEYQNRYVPRVPRDPAYAGQIGATAEDLFEVWFTNNAPEDLQQRVTELFELAKSGKAVRKNAIPEDEPLEPWASHSELALDLIGDVVDVWLGDYRQPDKS